MAALTMDRQTPNLGDEAIAPLLNLPVAAGQHIYAGAMIALNASRNVVNAATATTLTCIGRAGLEVDNTAGGDGALSVPVRQGVFAYNSGGGGDTITEAQVGSLVYIIDNQTVGATSGGSTRSIAGVVSMLASAETQGVVWVEQRLSIGALTNAIPTLTSPLPETQGGTGLASATAYAPLFGGTTSTAPLQYGTAGTTGQPLLSGGAGAIGAYGPLAPAGVKVGAIATDATAWGIEVAAAYVLPNNAAGATTRVSVPAKMEITDIQVIKGGTNGGAGDSLQVKNHTTTSAITPALSLNVNANLKVATSGTAFTNRTVALTDDLDLIQLFATDCGCTVIIRGILRA